MHEMDVALTDFGLAVLCTFFVMKLRNFSNRKGSLHLYWTIVFCSIGAGALLGGIAHGFFPDVQSLGYKVLWEGIFLSIGFTGFGVWNIGVTAFSQDFAVVVAYYLPSVIFLTACYTPGSFKNETSRFSKFGLVGSLTTLGAAAIQQLKISIHPPYFNHNALYHLVQAVGLTLLFIAASRQLAPLAAPKELK